MNSPPRSHASQAFLLSMKKITGLVDEGRTEDIAYLEISKDFDMIPIEELMMLRC